MAAFALGGIGIASAQNAAQQLQPLVDTTAQRLEIAEEVALAKWDSGAAVEDTAREAHVIQNAVKDGDAKNLDPISVSDFFKAQIEANKVVQYSLLADWLRAGRAPAHGPINLVDTIRPKLDQVQTALITELADTTMVRAAPTCRGDVAKAVGEYISAHPEEATALRKIALDVALSSTCTR